MPTQQALLSHAELTNDAAICTDSRSGEAAGDEPAGHGLSALRLVPVPDTGPPFDGDLPAGAAAAAPRPAGAGAPVYARDWAGGAVPDGHGRARATAGAGGEGRAGASPADDDWSRRFALLLTETLAGARPLRQLLPWTTERTRAHLDKLMPLFGGGQRPRVQRVLMSRPTRDAIEMTVLVEVGARTRALAVRLERALQAPARLRQPVPGRTPPRWLCTAIEAA